ncbi:MAG: T9SS type A sorting domain-containing protein [Candidatus Zixiibacteriota bacterium]
MKIMLFALALALSLSSPSAFAQTDAFGSLDSILISSATVAPGGRFSLTVTMVNDESIAAFAIPLFYSKSHVVLDSVSFFGSSALGWTNRAAAHDTAAGTLLLGAISINDAPIMAGRGKLADLYFHARSEISADVTTLIDSSFVLPAGFFEINTVTAGIISPAFVAGKITITAANRPPVFDPIAAKTVNEGDLVNFTVRASDPERSAVKLSAGRLVSGAKFTDNGNGSGMFTWQVPYIGAGSCNGAPISVVIVAGDGSDNASMEITFDVINRNRPPSISVSSNINAGAGDTLYIPFAATDPDFETVSFTATGLPAGAEMGNTNPGYLRWVSDIADSGDYTFSLNAKDESGATTTQVVDFRLLPSLPIEFRISDEQAFSGEQVIISLSLHNRVPVSGFQINLGYDRSLLTYINAVKVSTRIATWLEFFVVTTSDGKVVLSARAYPFNSETNALPVGAGEIARITFAVSGDLSYAGHYSNINFATIDPLSPAENAALGNDGIVIPRTQSLYTDGSILVKKYNGLIGDINLNGVPLEIGDAVYFTNSFIDPITYPLAGARLQNSDVNQDGVPATLADLIRLIQLFTGGGAKANANNQSGEVKYTIDQTDGDWRYRIEQPIEFAAALFTFAVDGTRSHVFELTDRSAGLEVDTHQDGEQLRVLIKSADGKAFRMGAESLFSLDGEFTAVSQQFVDEAGLDIPVSIARSVPLPTGYSLSQNYPNPFNPETAISFDLPKSGHARLEIFNILGELVATPIDQTLTAGRHSVTFSGVNDKGEELPSGVYFYRLRSEQFESTRKMVMMK